MLSKIPFWGWLIIIISVLYAIYNPLGFSLWHMWMLGDPATLLPFKLLATLIVGAFVGLVIHGTLSTTSWLGAIVMISLVVIGLWSVHTIVAFNLFSIYFWGWVAQPIVGTIFTIGWQWPKIWRRSTGAVSVNDPDTPN
jgi:hypothetical protein